MPDSTPAGNGAVPADWAEFDRDARPRLLAAFAYAARDGIDPDDVVQDVLIAARAHFVPLGPYPVMFAWCRARGAFTVLNVRKRGFGRWERPHGDPGAAVSDALAVPGVDGAAIDKALVDAVLRKLPEEDRDVLGLARAGLTPEEIAVRLGVRPGAIRMRLQRARRRFRNELGDGAPLLVPGGWRLRRTALRADLPALAGHHHAAAVSLTAAGLAVAVAAVLGATAPPAGSAAPDGAASRLHEAQGRGGATGRPPGRTNGAAGVVRAPSAARPALRSPGGRPPRTAARALRPAARVAACAVTVCIQSGGTPSEGDTLTVTALGPEGPGVTQRAAPVCEHVTANPAVACTRQDPGRWTVNEAPPEPPTGGTNP